MPLLPRAPGSLQSLVPPPETLTVATPVATGIVAADTLHAVAAVSAAPGVGSMVYCLTGAGEPTSAARAYFTLDAHEPASTIFGRRAAFVRPAAFGRPTA